MVLGAAASILPMQRNQPPQVYFVYLGRRGPAGRFTLELAQACRERPEIGATFVVSRRNPIAADLRQLGCSLLELETFESATSMSVARNFFAARRQLLSCLDHNRASAVVNLMPHVWTPLFGREIRRRGIRYVTIIHDALKHPGDATGHLTGWLRSEAHFADRVITLSRAVADQLSKLQIADSGRVRTLFHPDLRYDGPMPEQERDFKKPLKLLFFGRILKYKGLPTLLAAIELLRREGTHVELGVAGSGDIGKETSRLAALGAEVINRWVDDDEVGRLLARYDAIVLPYHEASQSGVAATAFGACMPVVGTAVGGITEQVLDGLTGVLASSTTAGSLADAIRRLDIDRDLCIKISTHLRQTSLERSMKRFLGEIIAESAVGVPRL